MFVFCRVVTSVSVVLNGQEPQLTDAIGKVVPRPLAPPQVASPINLLNPDRYEFYTFNDSGELVKRLMTMKEIQSIVAGGETDGALLMQNSPFSHLHQDPNANIQDIVTNVQNVLQREMDEKKNATLNVQNKLDTPDTSVSWSHILPAIFGNTGDQIVPDRSPMVGMTPDTVLYEKMEKTTAATRKPERQTTVTRPKQKPTNVPNRTTMKHVTRPAPSFASSSSSSSSYAPSSTSRVQIMEKKQPTKITAEPSSTEADVEFKEVSGTSYYVPPTTIAPTTNPPSTKYVVIHKRPVSTSATAAPETAGTLEDIIHTMSTVAQAKIDSSSSSSSSAATPSPSSASSSWPSSQAYTAAFSSSKQPSKWSTSNPTKAPTTILYSSIKAHVTDAQPSSLLTYPTKTGTTQHQWPSSSTVFVHSSSLGASHSARPNTMSPTTVPPASYTYKTAASSTFAASTKQKPSHRPTFIATTTQPPTTTNIITTEVDEEPAATTEYPIKWISTNSAESSSSSTEYDESNELDSTEVASTESQQLFDSHNSLNQIIESLKDEATTTQNGLLLATDDNMQNFFETTTMDEENDEVGTPVTDLVSLHNTILFMYLLIAVEPERRQHR